jgi:hypothetical protein
MKIRSIVLSAFFAVTCFQMKAQVDLLENHPLSSKLKPGKQVFGVNTTTCLLDSVNEYSWDSTAGIWNISSKIRFSYDSHNNPDEYTSEAWSGGVIVSTATQRVLYVYDPNNNPTTITYQDWSGSTWENSFKISYTYDANNNPITEIFENWIGSAWSLYGRQTSNYNVANKRTSSLMETWDGTAYVNNGQRAYTYDANGNMTIDYFQTWTGTTWENNSNTIFSYDASNNLITETFQGWTGGVWVNAYMSTYSGFDSYGNASNMIGEWWNGSAWKNYTSADLFYNCFTGIENNLITANDISVFPNPFSDQATLISDSDLNGMLMQVCDLQGRVIRTERIESNNVKIERTNLKSGVYLLKLISENKVVAVKKLLVK